MKSLKNKITVPLKAYQARVDELRFQLVENWCLCRYYQLFNSESVNFAHWISELKACIDKRRILVRMLVNDSDELFRKLLIMNN